MKRIPSFSALRAFEATAKTGSLKDAASQLNITPSAISHQIRNLEKDLNIELFERTKTGIRLTSIGEYYLESVQSALEIVKNATESISQNKDFKVLKISTLSTLSTLWLIPKLEEFHLQHPSIRINLLDDTNLTDFATSDLDASIRYDFHGKSNWPGLTSLALIEEYLMPVCAPKFLQDNPEIVEIDKLIKNRLLTNFRHPDEWQHWLTAVGADLSSEDLTSQVILDTSNMTLTAAKNNLGIALGRTPFVDKFLDSKELVRISSKTQFRGTRHYLVFPQKTQKNKNFKTFEKWIVSTAKSINTQYRQLEGEIFA